MERFSLVMAGGNGTRLWPISRKRKPKQILKIGETSLINATLDRIHPLVSRQFIVTSQDQEEIIRASVEEKYNTSYIIEPIAKNTAACILLSVLDMYRKYGDAILAVFPSDHYIPDTELFRNTVAEAFDVCEKTGRITLIGIHPTYPATGYGYIEYSNGQVNRFIEKPDIEVANELWQRNCLWNSGIFVFRLTHILSMYWTQLPAMYSLIAHSPDPSLHYAKISPISFDKGILEKITDLEVVHGNFTWNDVGNFCRLGETIQQDEYDNQASGNVVGLQSSGNIVFSQSKITALLGVTDYIIINNDDMLLICPKSEAENIGQLTEYLNKTGNGNLL